jgi:hypothetical protein
MTKSRTDLALTILLLALVAIGGLTLNVDVFGNFFGQNTWAFIVFLVIVIALFIYLLFRLISRLRARASAR